MASEIKALVSLTSYCTHARKDNGGAASCLGFGKRQPLTAFSYLGISFPIVMARSTGGQCGLTHQYKCPCGDQHHTEDLPGREGLTQYHNAQNRYHHQCNAGHDGIGYAHVELLQRDRIADEAKCVGRASTAEESKADDVQIGAVPA